MSVVTAIEAKVTAGARKWWALSALSLAVLAVGLDATVLSVALPTLAGSLRASATDPPTRWRWPSRCCPAACSGTGSAARR